MAGSEGDTHTRTYTRTHITTPPVAFFPASFGKRFGVVTAWPTKVSESLAIPLAPLRTAFLDERS